MSDTNEMEPRGHSQDSPLSVSQLNWYIKNLLETSLPSLWAEGEISDLSRPSSGHIYFTLKDEKSQIRSVIWRSTAERLRFKLNDGQSVICRGSVEVYPPRGSYQLIVNSLQPQGIGPLQLAFQQLHAKLSAQGLFDADQKQPLPRFPERIGFVTSPSGAAMHDFVEAARQRWNDFSLVIIPARVQGEQAKEDLCRAIRTAQKLTPKLDLLVVGRGGGSIEDLWCFNEEEVVRALAHCKIPTISAVGHEIDVTLSDLAADVRALTPTHAAQLALPNGAEIQTRLQMLQRQLDRMIWNRFDALKRRLENLQSARVIARPHDLHLLRRQQVDELEMDARTAIWDLLGTHREQLAALARATEALSPLAVLGRGYSLTRSTEKSPIRSIRELDIGDSIETILCDGSLDCTIEKIREDTH